MAFLSLRCMILAFCLTHVMTDTKAERRDLVAEERMMFQDLKRKLALLEKTLENRTCDRHGGVAASGTTYIRWGRTSCPSDGTRLVYSGYTGGSYYNHGGAAADNLCLPKNPDWGTYKDGTQNDNINYVFGAEYEIESNSFLPRSYHNMEVPCAVCETIGRSKSIMIPAKNKCSRGWKKEYSGYLMANNYARAAATEFVCMDQRAEKIGKVENRDGRIFYMVEGVCGSLQCPPYVQGRELTCVVCTK